MMDRSDSQVFERLTTKLSDAGVEFQHTHHDPVYTSTEAAKVRGSTLHSGAKALIVKGGDDFLMVVIPADLSLDSNTLRKHLHVRRLRFASKEEVLSITGLTPGSIPPFGSLFGLPTLCDERLAENNSINFNAGSHTESLRMSYVAYVGYESPEIAKVAR